MDSFWDLETQNVYKKKNGLTRLSQSWQGRHRRPSNLQWSTVRVLQWSSKVTKAASKQRENDAAICICIVHKIFLLAVMCCKFLWSKNVLFLHLPFSLFLLLLKGKQLRSSKATKTASKQRENDAVICICIVHKLFLLAMMCCKFLR